SPVMSSNRSGLQSGSAGPGDVTLATGGAVDQSRDPAGQPRERADAARNRAKVLAAAEDLFARRGMDAVTIDDVAAAAGVGKGTVYRRFGDKAGLGAALLDERGRQLQQDLISGAAPLGPGASPPVRLAAFVTAYLAFQARHLDLVRMSELPPRGRLRNPAYGFWRQHVRLLLGQCDGPDADIRAGVLLAALSAEQVYHWLHVEERPLTDLTAALVRTAVALTGTATG
ncbi:MAG TPA: TetR/AcrR family transcriptional regulator, partial [Micromonosporaceae bacterium]